MRPTLAATDSVPDPKRPPATWEALGPIAERAAATLLVLPVVAVLLWLPHACWAWHSSVRPGGEEAWHLPSHPWITWAAGTTACAVAWGALLRWGRDVRRSARPWVPALAAVGVLGALAQVGLLRHASTRGPRIDETITVGRGVEVAVVRYHADVFLVRLEPLLLRTRAVHLARGVDGVSDVPIVRPAGSGGAALRAGPAGDLCVVGSDGRCVAAARLDRRNPRYGPFWPGSFDLAALSPFALLASGDTGDAADLDAVLRRAGRQPGPAVYPAEEPLIDDLDNPNPWVRAAARRVIEAGGSLYPAALQRVRAGR